MKERVYTNPQDELEARANRYSAKGLTAMTALIILCWVLTLCNFFIISKTVMTQVALISVCFFLILITLLVMKDNAKPWLKYVILSIICILVAIIAGVLSFHAVLLYVLPIVFAGQYTKKSVVWFTYGINVITMAVSEIFAFYFGLCDLNILFESMGDHEHFMQIVNNGFQGLSLNANPVFVILVYATVPRAIIIGMVAILLSYINEKGRAEAAQMARLKTSSDLDFMTGCYNKNKFSEMAETYYKDVKNVSALYWDLNNLKKTNDEKGHKAGDALITRLSQVLLARAGDDAKVYRLGGDEFLVIIEDPSVVEEEAFKKDVEKMLGDRERFDISVAYGSARGAGEAICDVVNEADKRMYENKRIMKGEA